jgi:thioredoxin 1
MALKLNNENFDEVMGKGMPVVIDFWATWCGPCRMVSPIIDELSEEYADKVLIGKCDVEEGDEVAAKYMVRNVPTIIFLKDGKQVDKHVGAATKEQLKAKIDALL